MSMLAMTSEEQKAIDSHVEQMMDWAKTRSAEAEQLALDSARLMACTTDRIDRLKNQGFAKRCWSRFTGEAGAMERANVNDIIQMQKTAFRYVNMLQEQQLLMAHSLLSLKNNLVALAVKEEETRNLIAMLAQRTLERFERLEHRVDQLEISTNLQGWLLGLEEREYDEKIPTEYMRLFRVINDFYQVKNDNWNYNDLIFMRKAIRTVGINPKQKISLNKFIDTLTDEIQNENVGFDAYGQAITMFVPQGIENYSKFVVDNISSPVFASIHGLKTQFMDRLDMVEELQDEMNISTSDALKRLLRRSISNMNVNMDYEFPLAETAIEILGCLRLSEKLTLENNNSFGIEEEKVNQNDNQVDSGIELTELSSGKNVIIESENENQQSINIAEYSIGEWQTSEIKLGSSHEEIDSILLWNDKCFCANKKGVIWQSSDMKNWIKCAEFEGDQYDEGELFNSEKYICYKYNFDNKIFRSLDGKKWETVDSPKEFNGNNLTFLKAVFTDNSDIYINRYSKKYYYTKQVLFINTTETSYFNAPVIFYEPNSGRGKWIDFSEDYHKYEISSFIKVDDKFFVCLKEEGLHGDSIILYSHDCIKWNKLEGFNLKTVDALVPLNDKILVNCNRSFMGISLTNDGVYLYNPKDSSMELIKMPDGCNDITAFFDIAFSAGPGKVCISTNLKDWMQLEIPFEDVDKMAISKKMIVVTENNNLIHWAPFEKKIS